jgi:hypothetical protein
MEDMQMYEEYNVNALITKQDNGYDVEIVPIMDGDTLPAIASITVQYIQSDTPIVILNDKPDHIKTEDAKRFIDENWDAEATHEHNQTWFEGWVSGVRDSENIDDNVWDELIEYVKAKQ